MHRPCRVSGTSRCRDENAGMWHLACGMWHVACGILALQHEEYYEAWGIWHVACGMWDLACGMWHVALGMLHVAFWHCSMRHMACSVGYFGMLAFWHCSMRHVMSGYGIEEVWHVDCGIWIVAYDIWYVDCGMCHVVSSYDENSQRLNRLLAKFWFKADIMFWFYWTLLDPCSSNPCQNGGTCSSDSESFICFCPFPYVGDDCGTKGTIDCFHF